MLISKRILVAFFILISSVVFSCDEEFEVFEGGVFSLKLNQPKTLIDGTVLELIEIEDSRCPTNANCVWEGRSAVKVRWVRQESYDIELNDVEYVNAQVDGYLVTLLEVNPYPTLEAANEDKVVKIKIEAN
ncbi:hypothetical protein [uncultured Roseivirga sp.]|uniref:hypothetical protein n=1 Tax=uncultured Roseivirga sp. TaxID=543088 RepID=UPI0030D7026A|tara:strand:- start:4467 stop:4859 length:393 start_codon:yes stop_codon:yes gene_type:complete